jgi:hypothetical protein
LLAVASRAVLGLPENWERTVRWLRNKRARKEETPDPVPEKKQRANPEVPILHKYDGPAPDSIWKSFPKADLPKAVTTKVNTVALEKKVEESKCKMLPYQFARAKKALDFLKNGAPAYQKTVLPACKVSNTPSTSQYGLEVADTIATWVKKGFVSGPFREPPLPKFRINCLMAVNQGTKGQADSQHLTA